MMHEAGQIGVVDGFDSANEAAMAFQRWIGFQYRLQGQVEMCIATRQTSPATAPGARDAPAFVVLGFFICRSGQSAFPLDIEMLKFYTSSWNYQDLVAGSPRPFFHVSVARQRCDFL
jgi:hypothetical protein